MPAFRTKGPGDLLGDANAKGAQVDGLVEIKGAGPIFEGDTTADRELCVIQEGFAEGPQGEGWPHDKLIVL